MYKFKFKEMAIVLFSNTFTDEELKAVENDPQLASVGLRIIAYFIDRFIQIFIGIFSIILIISITEVLKKLFNLNNNSDLINAVVIFGSLFAIFGSYGYFLLRDSFVSLGRKVTGTRAVDYLTGEPIGKWRSFKRNLGLLVATPILPAIQLMYLLLRKSRMHEGDYWAKTKVIRLPEN